MQCHLCTLLPENSQLESGHEETSNKIKMKNIVIVIITIMVIIKYYILQKCQCNKGQKNEKD